MRKKGKLKGPSWFYNSGDACRSLDDCMCNKSAADRLESVNWDKTFAMTDHYGVSIRLKVRSEAIPKEEDVEWSSMPTKG